MSIDGCSTSRCECLLNLSLRATGLNLMNHLKHTSLLTLLLLLVATPAQSQENVLTKAVSDASWDRVSVAPGIELRTHQFESLLGLPQFISVLEIDLNAPGVRIDVVSPDSGLVRTSELAQRFAGIAAVNGGYFESDGTPARFLQSEMGIIRADDNDGIDFAEDGAVATDKNGDALIVYRPLPVWQSMPNYADILVAGPLLLWDSAIHQSDDLAFNLTHHPRTAAGLTIDNHLILVAADGRNIRSAGLTIHELALLMQALGCTTALNLDGGGSTTMWVEGRGIVNHPSDNKQFDADGERAVSNALIVTVER